MQSASRALGSGHFLERIGMEYREKYRMNGGDSTTTTLKRRHLIAKTEAKKDELGHGRWNSALSGQNKQLEVPFMTPNASRRNSKDYTTPTTGVLHESLRRPRTNSNSFVTRVSAGLMPLPSLAGVQEEANTVQSQAPGLQRQALSTNRQTTARLAASVTKGRSVGKDSISLSVDKLKNWSSRTKSVEEIKIKRFVHQRVLSNSFKTSLVNASSIRLKVMTDFVDSGMKSGHKSSRSQLGIHSSREPGSRVRTMTGEPKSESHEVSALFSVKRLQLDGSDTSGPGDMFHSNITLSQVTDTAVASSSQVKVHRAGIGLHAKTAEKFRFNPALYEGQPMKTYLVRKMQFKGNQTDTGFAKSFHRPAQVSAFTSGTGQTGGQDSSPEQLRTSNLNLAQLSPQKRMIDSFWGTGTMSSPQNLLNPSVAIPQQLHPLAGTNSQLNVHTPTAGSSRARKSLLRLHSQIRFCSGDEAGSRTQEALFEKIVLQSKVFYIFGLLDGLGDQRVDVVRLVRKELVEGLKKGLLELSIRSPDAKSVISELRTILSSVITHTAKELAASALDSSESGCTCLVGLIHEETIVRALLGDVVMLAGANTLTGFKVQSLAESHTISNREEQNRIRRLIESKLEEDLSGDTNSEHNHVSEQYQNLQQGKFQLPLTRALGFTCALSLGLTWLPEIKTFRLSRYDEFILIATQSAFKGWNPDLTLRNVKEDFEKSGSLERTADKLNQEFRMKLRSNIDQEDITFLLIRVERS